jgi:hypothetical protein
MATHNKLTVQSWAAEARRGPAACVDAAMRSEGAASDNHCSRRGKERSSLRLRSHARPNWLQLMTSTHRRRGVRLQEWLPVEALPEMVAALDTPLGSAESRDADRDRARDV